LITTSAESYQISFNTAMTCASRVLDHSVEHCAKQISSMVLYTREMALNSMPNRLFEYMASGLAVVMPGCSTEAMGILTAENCGMGVDSDNPEDVARAILWLCENRDTCWEMGRNGLRAFAQRHNWEAEFGRVLARMDELSAGGYGAGVAGV